MLILLAGSLFFYYKAYMTRSELLERALSLFIVLVIMVIGREEIKLLRRNIEKLWVSDE